MHATLCDLMAVLAAQGAQHQCGAGLRAPFLLATAIVPVVQPVIKPNCQCTAPLKRVRVCVKPCCHVTSCIWYK